MSPQTEIVHIDGVPHLRIYSGPVGSYEAIRFLADDQVLIHNVAPCEGMHALVHDGTSLLMTSVPEVVDLNVFIYDAEYETELSLLEDGTVTFNIFGGYLVRITPEMEDALQIPNVTIDIPAMKFITYV